MDRATGAYVTELALEPPLDAVARLEGLEAPPARRALAPAMRQIVAHECMVETIRRGDAQRAARGGPAEAAAAEQPGRPMVWRLALAQMPRFLRRAARHRSEPSCWPSTEEAHQRQRRKNAPAAPPPRSALHFTSSTRGALHDIA